MPHLSEKIRDAFNEQINVELNSAYSYLGMAVYATEATLMGAASWLRLQAEEELGHATKLIDYMTDRGGGVELKGISQPPINFESLRDVFRNVLEHERKVTASIYRMYDLVAQERDYAAQALLDWYVNEQVEEENSALEVLRMLELAGDSGPGLLMVDRRLAERARA